MSVNNVDPFKPPIFTGVVGCHSNWTWIGLCPACFYVAVIMESASRNEEKKFTSFKFLDGRSPAALCPECGHASFVRTTEKEEIWDFKCVRARCINPSSFFTFFRSSSTWEIQKDDLRKLFPELDASREEK